MEADEVTQNILKELGEWPTKVYGMILEAQERDREITTSDLGPDLICHYIKLRNSGLVESVPTIRGRSPVNVIYLTKP